MDDAEARMECLKLAVIFGGDAFEIARSAQVLAWFVATGQVAVPSAETEAEPARARGH